MHALSCEPPMHPTNILSRLPAELTAKLVPGWGQVHDARVPLSLHKGVHTRECAASSLLPAPRGLTPPTHLDPVPGPLGSEMVEDEGKGWHGTVSEHEGLGQLAQLANFPPPRTHQLKRGSPQSWDRQPFVRVEGGDRDRSRLPLDHHSDQVLIPEAATPLRDPLPTQERVGRLRTPQQGAPLGLESEEARQAQVGPCAERPPRALGRGYLERHFLGTLGRRGQPEGPLGKRPPHTTPLRADGRLLTSLGLNMEFHLLALSPAILLESMGHLSHTSGQYAHRPMKAQVPRLQRPEGGHTRTPVLAGDKDESRIGRGCCRSHATSTITL